MIQLVKIIDLEPIVTPEAVAFWPPQPGWYVVIILLLILLYFAANKIVQKRRRNAYRKRALIELKNLSNRSFSKNLVPELNALLKVTALHGYPRNEVASLTGSKWLRFLETTEPKVKFSKAPGIILAEASFIPTDQLQLNKEQWNELIGMSQDWIKRHKTGN